MKDSITQRMDKEFKMFTKNSIELPRNVNNLDKIRFYIEELSKMIKGLEQDHGYVPIALYQLLLKFNGVHNELIYEANKTE